MVKINRFEVVSGIYIEKILGQSRIGYYISDEIDFYDMAEMSKKKKYQGSTLSFYDYHNRKIYKPFKRERNVIYSSPVYLNDYFWFLQGDYNKGEITLFRYQLNEIPKEITKLNISEVNLYNLIIIGHEVHIISQEDDFECYYPKKFKFCKGLNESVEMITDDKVYFTAWVEEGWDDENNCATEEYRYYHKVVVRDFNGTILSEEVGSLDKTADGSWWIS